MNTKTKILIWTLTICTSFLNCSIHNDKIPPSVENGAIDLQDWDFEKDGPVKLNGQWGFIWREFIDPEKFILTRISENKNYYPVPKLWNPIINKSDVPVFKQLDSTGFATYFLKLKGLKPNKNIDLALKVDKVYSAYNLYIIPLTKNIDNKIKLKPLMGKGVPGKNKGEEIPHVLSLIKKIPANSDETIIMFHVSNHYMFVGGITNEVLLGKESDLLLRSMYHDRISFLVMGILLIIFLYHMILFLVNKKDKGNLLLSLICFFILSWFSLYEKLLQGFITEPSPNIYMLIELITTFAYYIVFPLFVSLLWYLFKGILPRILIPFLWITTGIVFLLRFIDYTTSDYLFLLFNLFMILCTTICLIYLVRAVLNKRAGSFISLLGVIIFSITASNDILKTHEVLTTLTLAPYGLICFIIAHSYLLSKKYTGLLELGTGAEGAIFNIRYKKTRLSGVDIKESKKILFDLMEKKEIFRDENLSIKTLGSELSMTSHQLSELLNNKMNTNFKSFINDYRVKEAKKLLKENKELSIISIAFDVGFNSNANFYRIFKGITGLTPKEYRDRNAR